MTRTPADAPEHVFSCDLDTGVCAVGPGSDPEPASVSRPAASSAGVVQVTYVTDPICSACWAMEPAWRALQFHYGDLLDVRHVYGGLLPGWQGFADAGAGIAGPGDVAEHWEEIARHSGQPIDAGVWRDDPMESSFAPSVAATAVRLVAPEREEAFLRRLRELLFLDGRNIARPQAWRDAALASGVDPARMREHLLDGSAEAAFVADLRAAAAAGAHAFPTLIVESNGNRLALRGTQSFDRLEQVVTVIAGLPARSRSVTIEEAVAVLDVGTTAEYAAVLGVDDARAAALLVGAGLRPTRLVGGLAWRR